MVYKFVYKIFAMFRKSKTPSLISGDFKNSTIKNNITIGTTLINGKGAGNTVEGNFTYLPPPKEVSSWIKWIFDAITLVIISILCAWIIYNLGWN